MTRSPRCSRPLLDALVVASAFGILAVTFTVLAPTFTVAAPAFAAVAAPVEAPAGSEQETDTPVPEGWQEAYQRLVTELMSPFCKGLVLKDCPSAGAARMREQVREWLREGRGEDWITARLVEQYGEMVRGSPEFSGFGIVAWLAPVVALAGGLIVLVAFLRGRGGRGEGASAPGSMATRTGGGPTRGREDREDAGDADADSEAIRRRVEAELEELDDR